MSPSAGVSELVSRLDGRATRVYRAPGRVNLIGEHTDYNDGFVMPVAIARHTWVAAAPRPDRRVTVYSDNFHESVEWSLDALPGPSRHWSDYIVGVACALEEAGHRLAGADLVVRGDVPIGAGLSSSASLEVATATALADLSNLAIEPAALALACQRAEHVYAGTLCGIMDQLISACGRADHALLIDCRSLALRAVPLPGSARLVVFNSRVRHDHASGEYNLRRAECAEGVRVLAETIPGLASLRDVTARQWEQGSPRLSARIARRCRHVLRENARVIDAAAALEAGDLAGVGRLMYESHESLRDDYEVSCPELDILVELARGAPGVYGSRMTGGGFGGCTVTLVAAEQVDELEREVVAGYRRITGLVPDVYVCAATGAASRVDAP